jgi:hypothetical protein
LHSKAVVYDLLFRAAPETMITIAADTKHLDARIGTTAVLHTWGSALTHHPHVHMIVSGGRHRAGRKPVDILAPQPRQGKSWISSNVCSRSRWLA